MNSWRYEFSGVPETGKFLRDLDPRRDKSLTQPLQIFVSVAFVRDAGLPVSATSWGEGGSHALLHLATEEATRTRVNPLSKCPLPPQRAAACWTFSPSGSVFSVAARESGTCEDPGHISSEMTRKVSYSDFRRPVPTLSRSPPQSGRVETERSDGRAKQTSRPATINAAKQTQ